MNIFIGCVALVLLALTAVYWIRFRGHPKEILSPAVSWIRAGIFFCTCFLVSWATGTLPDLLSGPIATPGQLQNPAWIAWTAGCFLLVTAAYWGIWARWTLTFDRRRCLIPQILFGVVWGLSVGQMFLVFWKFCGMFGLPVWGRWIAAYIVISLGMGLWQDLYWDVYVIPEHDTPFSLKWKVVCSHVPNMTICLVYLALYDNRIIFVGLQTLALTGAAVAMRFPPFWVKDYIHPPRTLPGLFGLPHAAGYVPEEQKEGKSA